MTLQCSWTSSLAFDDDCWLVRIDLIGCSSHARTRQFGKLQGVLVASVWNWGKLFGEFVSKAAKARAENKHLEDSHDAGYQ